MLSVVIDLTLEGELDEELGYSMYDYKNKDTDNTRNGHSRKTMHANYGDLDINVLIDQNTDYEQQINTIEDLIDYLEKLQRERRYFLMMTAFKNWTENRHNWGKIHSELTIFFKERIPA